MRRFPTDNAARPVNAPGVKPAEGGGQGPQAPEKAADLRQDRDIRGGAQFRNDQHRPGVGAKPGRPSVDGVVAARAQSTHLNEPRRALPAGWSPVSAADLIRPGVPAQGPADSEAVQAGQAVRAQVQGDAVAGPLRGYDYKGRPVLTAEGGERRIAQWKDLELVGEPQEVAIPVAGLHPKALIRPPAKLVEALNKSFDIEVCGPHRAREYIDAFHDAGHFVYLTGGAIRDALNVLANNPKASTEQIIETLKDIDIVTTAPPPVSRAIAEKIAPEYKDGAVFSPPIVDQFGSVLLGGPKAGLPNPEGLDVTTMRTDGAFAEQMVHPDTGENAFPYTFDHSLALDAETRDFACNTLYYDPLNGVIVDPTGYGVQDAQDKKLRITRDATLEKDDSIALRFFKFRMRGYAADPKTLKTLRHQSSRILWQTPRWKVVNNLLRIAPKDAANRQDLEKFFKALGDVMTKDGCAKVFHKRLMPQFDRVLRKVENRARRNAQ